MTDTPPNRMSVNPSSPHFDEELLRRGVGVRFNGRERTDVEEYSVSEGWIRVAAGKSRDRYGQPMTLKLSGTVETWFHDTTAAAGAEQAAAEAAPVGDEVGVPGAQEDSPAVGVADAVALPAAPPMDEAAG